MADGSFLNLLMVGSEEPHPYWPSVLSLTAAAAVPISQDELLLNAAVLMRNQGNERVMNTFILVLTTPRHSDCTYF